MSAVRLQKFLSGAGVASRRTAEAWIQAGRVRVNGEVVLEMGRLVEPGSDVVEVDGREVRPTTERRWVMLNKPTGTLTTRRDPGGRPTIYQLLPPELSDLRYVGRLDRETEGLLILTNDGDALHGLTHPSREVEREYRATVKGAPDARTLQRLRTGVTLEDGPARATRARLERAGDPAVVRIVLTEGRKREVRRMLEAVGHPVVSLERIRFGPLTLGSLARGAWRNLNEAEVRALRQAARRSGGSSGPGQRRARPSRTRT